MTPLFWFCLVILCLGHLFILAGLSTLFGWNKYEHKCNELVFIVACVLVACTTVSWIAFWITLLMQSTR